MMTIETLEVEINLENYFKLNNMDMTKISRSQTSSRRVQDQYQKGFAHNCDHMMRFYNGRNYFTNQMGVVMRRQIFPCEQNPIIRMSILYGNSPNSSKIAKMATFCSCLITITLSHSAFILLTSNSLNKILIQHQLSLHMFLCLLPIHIPSSWQSDMLTSQESCVCS